MRSLKFPNMFNSNTTNVWRADEYINATRQNVTTLILSERGELLGDPYFGLMLRHYLFEQNNYVLKDMLIDMIYSQIAYFLPQVKVNRNNINIIQDKEKGKVYITFTGINQIDYTPNTYNIPIVSDTTK